MIPVLLMSQKNGIDTVRQLDSINANLAILRREGNQLLGGRTPPSPVVSGVKVSLSRRRNAHSSLQLSHLRICRLKWMSILAFRSLYQRITTSGSKDAKMLILSRKVDESIDFPALGISVSVIHVQGSRVRIGVTAPPDVSILRSELNAAKMPDSRNASLPMLASAAKSLDHQAKNQLNLATLGIQLAQRQLAAGQAEKAEQSLQNALRVLADLEMVQTGKMKKGCTESDSRLRSNSMIGSSSTAVADLELKPWRCTQKMVDVLLVEDDDNERALLQGLLENEGYSVQTANDGLHALECLSEVQPRVVLMDMMMPRSSGKQTIDHIRSHQHLQDLPICVVSGSSPDSVGLSENSQITDWFPKPLNARRLIDRLRKKVLFA